MAKKITALFLALSMVLIFASCSGGDTYYTDEDGARYLVVRDSDGNIVINSSGKLAVYTLNENGKKQKADSGEYITEYIDFNGQVVSGGTVETAEMRFTLPDGFTADASLPGYFSYDSRQGEIFFNYYDKDIETEAASVEYNCESLLESYGSEAFSYEKYTVSVDSVECTVYKQVCTSSEYYKTVYFYLIPYDTGYYLINCMVSTDYGKKVDFDKFAESIHLK